jgi:hypothetical protein
MIAPATAAAITAHSGTVPREAATPPKMTAISPGKTKPTNAEASSAGKANTSARTSQPGSDKIRSVTLVTRPTVATAAHPARDMRRRHVAGAASAGICSARCATATRNLCPGVAVTTPGSVAATGRAFVVMTHLGRRPLAR